MKNSHHLLSSTLLGLALLVPCAASAAAPSIDKSDPEAERRALKVADGFEINLFAADPMIRKPIEMNFDADGRLWVASSVTYPQIKPGQEPHDQVIVLEDTTGSGRADKATVFANGLFIPTGIVPGDGGAYVANSTEMLHLKDTTGGLHANQRRVVLSGFGTEDTHHIIHAFRWGNDGRIYFNQSIYIHSNIETPWGAKRLQGSGTWRFRPETMQLDVYCRGQVNPWGIAWDNWGETFETDGAGFEGIAFAYPGSAFQSAVGYQKVLPGLNHGSPKYCSLAIVDGRAMPEDWRGTFLTSDFRANRIVRFRLSDEGSGFVSRQLPDFITSKDIDFRPVDIKLGPDGAIYIADWYNPIINHGEVDFRDPRRDHVHGRIWRVTAKGMPLVKRPKLSKAPVDELLEALKSPEQYTRLRAKLVMRERGAAQVVPSLSRWVKKLDPKSAATEHARLEALWAYESMDVVEPELLNQVLSSKDFRARAAAVRVLSHWARKIDNAIDLLKKAIDDESPRVRLEAVRALVETPVPEAVTIAAHVLDHPMDEYLDFALSRTNIELESVWMPAFQAGKLTSWEKPAHVARALKDVKSPAAIDTLVTQLKSNQVDPAARAGVIDLIASIESPKQVSTLFELADGKVITDSATRVHVLQALEKIVRQKQPGEDFSSQIQSLMADQELAIRATAIRLAGAMKVQKVRPELSQLAENSGTPDEVRFAAMNALADLGGEQSVAELKKLSEASNAQNVRRAAVAALAEVDLKEAASRAADLLTSGSAGSDPATLLRAFIQRAGGADALAGALASKQMPADEAKLSLRFLQTLGTEETALTGILRKSAGFSEGPTKLSPEQTKQLMAEVTAKGDAARGERIFRRKDMSCYQCHAIGGAGGFLAPDLSSIGASSPLDYIIDSILDPNKAIKDGYQGYAVITKDGDAISGIKVRQDDKILVLRDATRPEITIPLESVRREKQIGSLMPTGLADPLTHQEFLDLVRFLSELGKPGPYGPTPAMLVRRWRIMEAPPATVFTGDLPPSVAAEGSNWLPTYSLVSGELPLDAFRTLLGKKVSYCRCNLQVSAAGKVRLVLNDAAGVSLWVDGKRVDVKSDLTIDVTAGTRVLTFAMDFAQRGKVGLRVELAETPGGGHAQPVGGM